MLCVLKDLRMGNKHGLCCVKARVHVLSTNCCYKVGCVFSVDDCVVNTLYSFFFYFSQQLLMHLFAEYYSLTVFLGV